MRALVESPNVRARAAEADLILRLGRRQRPLARRVRVRADHRPALADAVTEARGRYVENLRGHPARAARGEPDRADRRRRPLRSVLRRGRAPGALGSSVVLQWNTLAAETALAFPGRHGRADVRHLPGPARPPGGGSISPEPQGLRLIANADAAGGRRVAGRRARATRSGGPCARRVPMPIRSDAAEAIRPAFAARELLPKSFQAAVAAAATPEAASPA